MALSTAAGSACIPRTGWTPAMENAGIEPGRATDEQVLAAIKQVDAGETR